MDDEGDWMSYPDRPWDLIWHTNTPTKGSLWQGGMYYGPQATPRGVDDDDFNMVISMAGRGSGPTRVFGNLSHEVFYIEDNKLGPVEMSFVSEAKDLATQAIHSGLKVLVRCQMGLNRSGLVVALTLVNLGFPAQGAIELIRGRRSRNALHNPWFVEYIHNYAAHVGMPSQEEGTNVSE